MGVPFLLEAETVGGTLMLHPAPEFVSDCAFADRASLHYTNDFQTMRAILRLPLYVSL